MAHALTNRPATLALPWKRIMLVAGVLLSAALFFDFVAPPITALAVLTLAFTAVASRKKWGMYPLAAINLLIVGAFGIQIIQKGVMFSAYGCAHCGGVKDFVGVAFGVPIALVGLVACLMYGFSSRHPR